MGLSSDILPKIPVAQGPQAMSRSTDAETMCWCAQTFCRKFRWHELILWPEDMPAHALIALSDKDDLVPSPLVAKHISDAHPTATVMYHPTAGHGGFLIDVPWQRNLVQVGSNSLLTVLTPPYLLCWLPYWPSLTLLCSDAHLCMFTGCF